ncbi:universal stress protein [Streptomyces sp. SID8379]|uniref:universal stress protein n=1 Tax=unclassified Streptomyces TaxID=2593676 RepID=UPI00036E5DAF|nr:MULTISPECIES: universal stress protein [unclassified Streptomyces]MYW66970.1 universal stress protein [Streptomyces sp. SID8379]
MTSIRVLSVGTDGSRESLDAADWAAREALRRGLPLRLVHAESGQRLAPLPPDVDLPRRTVLDRTALHLSYTHPSLEFLARRSPRPPAAALLDAATDSEALVLGSRGFTGYTGFLVGSVSLAVTARAPRPVVLVRAGALPQDEHTPEGAFRPVVVGLDVTAPADEILSYAFEAAALRAAPLHAVHAWALPPLRADTLGDTLPGGDAARRETLRRLALSGALQAWRAKYPEVAVTERLLYGQPGHHLLKASTGASLTVIGRRADSTHLGCTAHSVVHHSTSPVAVVPHT